MAAVDLNQPLSQDATASNSANRHSTGSQDASANSANLTKFCKFWDWDWLLRGQPSSLVDEFKTSSLTRTRQKTYQAQCARVFNITLLTGVALLGLATATSQFQQWWFKKAPPTEVLQLTNWGEGLPDLAFCARGRDSVHFLNGNTTFSGALQRRKASPDKDTVCHMGNNTNCVDMQLEYKACIGFNGTLPGQGCNDARDDSDPCVVVQTRDLEFDGASLAYQNHSTNLKVMVSYIKNGNGSSPAGFGLHATKGLEIYLKPHSRTTSSEHHALIPVDSAPATLGDQDDKMLFVQLMKSRTCYQQSLLAELGAMLPLHQMGLTPAPAPCPATFSSASHLIPLESQSHPSGNFWTPPRLHGVKTPLSAESGNSHEVWVVAVEMKFKPTLEELTFIGPIKSFVLRMSKIGGVLPFVAIIFGLVFTKKSSEEEEEETKVNRKATQRHLRPCLRRIVETCFDKDYRKSILEEKDVNDEETISQRLDAMEIVLKELKPGWNTKQLQENEKLAPNV